MLTIACKWLMRHTQDYMANNPDAGRSLMLALQEMNAGKLPAPFLDAIVQKHVDPFDVHDAYAYILISQLVAEGHLAMRVVPVEGMPFSDSMEVENNRRLATLPHPFRANFVGGLKTIGDGEFWWTEPVEFLWTAKLGEPQVPIVLPPKRVVLEVGTTASYTTVDHILRDLPEDAGGLARWPYNTNLVTIFRRVPVDLQIRERGYAAPNMVTRGVRPADMLSPEQR